MLNVSVICLAILLLQKIVVAARPLRVTIDCASDSNDYVEDTPIGRQAYNSDQHFDVESFCRLIHKAIPKTIKDGKFVLVEPDSDQMGFSDTQTFVAVTPPDGFHAKKGLPPLRLPNLKVPKLNVPKLRDAIGGPLKAPRIGKPMKFPRWRAPFEEDTSSERMEKFKKGVQKMLHAVKVLGQLDQYLSERTRIIIDKLSKTFAE